jgi:RHS repeat-associated protein
MSVGARGSILRAVLAVRGWVLGGVGASLGGTVVAVVAVSFSGLAFVPGAAAASVGGASLESAGVRAALAKQLQQPGPSIVSQGGSGGSGDAAVPTGELVPSLSSEFSDTWLSAKKGLVARVFAEPINYKSAAGEWHPIENALTSRALGGYENTANRFSLVLPEALSTGVTLTEAGRSVSFSLQGAVSSLPSVTGDTATYANVLAATDLSYVSESAGVQEIATLENSQAPDQLRYALSTSGGLSPQREADGSIALVDEQGNVWFTIPTPRAFVKGASPSTARALPTSIAAVASGWVLTVSTDEAWLREDLTSGAVLVDPSVEAASQACTLAAEAPTTSSCSSSTLQEGEQTGALEHHALLKFPLTSIPTGAVVINAKLGLYVQSTSTTSAKAVGVYRVTKPWTTAATWDTYDGTHAWSTPGGDYANPEHNSDASINPSVGATTGWYYWYPDRMVQEWLNGINAPEGEGKTPEGYANEGLIVKDEIDGHTANLLTLASPSASSDTPYLEVSYEPRGFGVEPQYTQLSTALTDKMTMSINPASGNLRLANQDMNVAGTDGLNFSSLREFNNLDPEVHEYGRWSDSTHILGLEASNGDVEVWDNGTVFPFEKQSNGTFITPPGIKAALCTAGQLHCPATLPAGTHWRLVFETPNEPYVDISDDAEPEEIANKYGDKLTATVNEEGVSWTDTGGRAFKYADTWYDDHSHTFVNELKDVAGSRKDTYTYGPETEGGGSQLRTYKDAVGNTTEYEYESYDLTKLTLPGNEVIKFKYNASNQLTELIKTDNAAHTKGPTTTLTYYEPGSAPTPCTAKQKGTVIKDPDWKEKEKPGIHEILYCSNVLDEVEQTVESDGNEKEPFKEGNKATSTYNPFGDEKTSTAASPGNSESGNEITRIFGMAGVNLECEITGTSTEASSCAPNKEALVTAYAYHNGTAKFSTTHVRDPEGYGVTGCYNAENQEEKLEEEEVCNNTGEPAGSLASEKDQRSEQNELKFTYEKDGNMATSTTADGQVTKYEYDSQGQLEKIKPPSPLVEITIKNDADGRPEVITTGSVHKQTVTYSALDRVSKIVYSGTGAEKTVKYTYGPNGNITKRVDSTGTTTYTYDKLNRLTKEELPSGATNSYGYDEASNLTSFIDSGGTTEYRYNGNDEIESMVEPGAGTTKFGYNGDRALDEITYPSGVIEKYTLEGSTGRPETITVEHINPAGPPVPTLSYNYKKSGTDTGLIQSVEENPASHGPITQYKYEQLNRLTEAVTELNSESRYAYTLNGNGDITEQEVNTSGDTGGEKTYYGYNGANELVCSKVGASCSEGTGTSYSYDGAGELTASGSTKFSYNAASELTNVSIPTGAEEAFSFAGTGQDDLVKAGSATLQNSLLGLTQETTSAGTSYFARLPNGLLIDERTPSGDFNPVYDAQGDIIAFVNSSADAVRTIHYGPYGESKIEGGTAPFLFGYKGGYRIFKNSADESNDRPSGMYHFGQRVYEPATARWTQQDPLDQVTGVTQSNRFSFAGDDPINRADPSGQFSVENAGEKCLEGGARSALVSGGDPEEAATGCAFGAAAVIAKEEGCEECGEVIEAVGDVEDAESLLE